MIKPKLLQRSVTHGENEFWFRGFRLCSTHATRFGEDRVPLNDL